MLAIILAIENDDDRSFVERLYLQYRYLLLKKTVELLGSSNNIEDAVQQVFARIIANVDKFDRSAPITCDKTRNQIVILIRSVCSNMRRKEGRVELFSLDEEYNAPTESYESIEQEVVARWDYQRLKEFIDKQDDLTRQILYMRASDYTFAQIATEMQLVESTVRMRYKRAKDRILSEYQQEEATI